MSSIAADPPRLLFLRVFIGAGGVVLIGLGLVFALMSLPLDDIGHLGIWLVMALIIHDAVIAPIVAVAASFALPLARTIGPVYAAIARASLVASACAALVAIPGIAVRIAGPRNSTIHTTDYLFVVAIMWLSALTMSAACVLAGWLARKRRADRGNYESARADR
ncbi:hypothetical protein FHX48_001101 [Microbacterium halimionae]|uniref:Uncharacterized protein n=1 Tax=Microbacterium halimionae TaxID=1526413 RepID=A0A7W3PLC0_9MICO|nr:hypothetical protein [Microbacterium halimionae]MBA8816028.1 hypothetical protein [Microbacterium halimionae]NII96230.1 hypothetical protein [Microbacterium halimionae]